MTDRQVRSLSEDPLREHGNPPQYSSLELAVGSIGSTESDSNWSNWVYTQYILNNTVIKALYLISHPIIYFQSWFILISGCAAVACHNTSTQSIRKQPICPCIKWLKDLESDCLPISCQLSGSGSVLHLTPWTEGISWGTSLGAPDVQERWSWPYTVGYQLSAATYLLLPTQLSHMVGID